LGYCYSSPAIHFKSHAIASAGTGMCLGLLTYHAGHSAYTGNGWSYPGGALPVFMAGVTIWMGLVGGLTKDLSDVAGDVAAGRHTVPVIWGEARARRAVVAAALGLAVGFCAAGASTSALLIWPGMAMLGGATALTIVCLGRFTPGNQPSSRRPYRVFMTTQYLMNLSVVPSLTGQLLSG
jgi:4-hydroxybenzoate polyprenyltransferase